MLKSNGVVSLTKEQAVMRAVAAAYDKQRYYGLGRGGRYPNSMEPYDHANRVDCSGFVCYALGFDRLQILNRLVPSKVSGPRYDDLEQVEFWWSTDTLYDEARMGYNFDWFEKVPKASEVLPGDVLVYPDYRVNGETKQGHTGIVTKVLPGFVRGAADWYKYVRVAHATPTHRKKYGNVVAITDASAWRVRETADGKKIGGTFIRYTKFKPDSLAAVSAPPKPLPLPPQVAKVTPDPMQDRMEEPQDEASITPLILRLANMFPKQRARSLN